ncbi:hypothetical protein LEMA_P120310.1 [Plenodomus lingam JN3]|uniref:Rrn9 domain-containing protein n=1 Tax=Leptosphaeria maculans (strain JN3 / isolate v23.1.3 / race Av1-4-5-6-7-8) TaxID=985895 RepID=E4ZSV2_LEPMJ|nr:hypothetical protein LEMA_P120310.1 [Plenodomus lingam JN3]CBX94540.1 hypothetical protein LEMA_P120310.1 [Plenodomus lingam JN3]
MSLFGGESAPTTTDGSSESEILESHANERSSPPIAVTANPQSTHNSSILIDSDASDEIYSDEEVQSDNESISRPNRFTGQSQTWKGYTAADRQIAASLERIQNSDLAAHLYNAHALKCRVRRPIEELAELKSWQSRDVWLRTGKNLQNTDAAGLAQTELVPSRDWTAWPLPPEDRVPLQDDAVAGQGLGAPHEWSIGGEYNQDAGRELRDEMLAVFLRIAKENWNARDTDEEEVPNKERNSLSRSRSQSKNRRSSLSQRSASGDDTKMKNRDEEEADEENEEVRDDVENETSGKKRGRKVQMETLKKPTFLADDEIAYRLLQPSINSMLIKLDELAIAIQRTRLNHFAQGEPGDRSSQSDFNSATESAGKESDVSVRGLSRRQTSRYTRSRTPSRAASPRKGDTMAKVATSRSGSPEGTDYDSVMGDTSDTDKSAKSHVRKRARSASTASAGSETAIRDRARAGLIDWSEVLGLAAVKGWDERALARTAQRCANLFGESMSFMPFDADAVPQALPEPVTFSPATIPAPNVPSVLGSSSGKRPFFQVGTLRCPHEDCYGHAKDFALPYRVVEHCIRVHGYDPRTNINDNETRTLGGVQIDGFLQPVTVKPGWLGHGRMKAGKTSKKQKRERDEESADADAVDAVETVEV